MATKKRRKPAAKNGQGTADDTRNWNECLQPFIAGEPLAKNGLPKRREELERIIERHVTSRKIGRGILFRGKQRYLKTQPSGPGRRQVNAAMLALQCLYNVEAAAQAGDIDTAIMMTHDFALYDLDVRMIEKHGWDGWSAQAFLTLERMFANSRHRRRVDIGKLKTGKTKLKPEQDSTLLRVRRKHHGHGRGWFKAMMAELRDEWGINASESCIRRRLRQLLSQEED